MRTGMMIMLALMLVAGDTTAEKRKKKQEKPKGAEVEKKGKIQVVRGLQGGEPQLTDERGVRFLCSGPLKGELLRLHGHGVGAWGVPGEKKMMTPTFKVVRYAITDAGGGQKPLVGVLRREGKRYQLHHTGGQVTLRASAAFMRRLARRVGCKIWVVGELDGPALKAYKFGWLNCRLPKPIRPRKETTK